MHGMQVDIVIHEKRFNKNDIDRNNSIHIYIFLFFFIITLNFGTYFLEAGLIAFL